MFRISWGSVLVFVTVIFICLACWIAKERRQSSIERRVAVQLEDEFQHVKVVFGGPFDTIEILEGGASQGTWRRAARRLLGERAIGLLADGIVDLRPIGALSSLKKLRLEGRSISDVSPLSNLRKLEHLWIDVTSVKDLTPLSELSNLEHLTLHGSSRGEPTHDMTSLARLRRLQALNLEMQSVDHEQIIFLRNAWKSAFNSEPVIDF